MFNAAYHRREPRCRCGDTGVSKGKGWVLPEILYGLAAGAGMAVAAPTVAPLRIKLEARRLHIVPIDCPKP